MDTLTAITTRRSAGKLGAPGPTRSQLADILDAGTRAPDHGRLSPWRFIVLEGKARERLGAAMAALKKRNKPEAGEAELQSERAKADRAPVIVAVAARPTLGKIPEVEQLLTVGASVQNMWLAAHALGLGAMWKTGEAAYDDAVKAELGFEPGDKIVAFLYLGTVLSPGQGRELSVEAVTSWLDPS